MPAAVERVVKLFSGDSQTHPQPGNASNANAPTTEVADDPQTPKEGGKDTGKDASSEDQAKGIDEEISKRFTNQILSNQDTEVNMAKIRSLLSEIQDLFKSRKSDAPLFMKFTSYDDWLASQPRLREVLGGSWRSELLNQYMYLISAPFLAIVTYYIIDLLGLNKQGVVVLIVFSVGLISEKIVSWILGIATGYMANPKTSLAPNK